MFKIKHKMFKLTKKVTFANWGRSFKSEQYVELKCCPPLLVTECFFLLHSWCVTSDCFLPILWNTKPLDGDAGDHNQASTPRRQILVWWAAFCPLCWQWRLHYPNKISCAFSQLIAISTLMEQQRYLILKKMNTK